MLRDDYNQIIANVTLGHSKLPENVLHS